MKVCVLASSGKSYLKKKCQRCLRGERNPCDDQCSLYLFKKVVDEKKYLEDVRIARERRIKMFEEEEVNAKRKMQSKLRGSK